MKNKTSRYSILVLSILCFILGSCKQQFKTIPNLAEMVRLDHYSDLYTELTLNRANYDEPSLLFYDIILKSVMNKPDESNRLIEEFKAKYKITSDSVNYYIIQTEYNNYVKLYDYKMLKAIGDELIAKYKSFMDSSDYIELIDDNLKYSYLKNEKSITLIKQKDTYLKVSRDLAGYTLMDVKNTKDSTVSLIFDTGANVNAIIESAAKKLNLRIIPDAKIYVMGATGARNQAQIGIADTLTIGNITILNAEFVVFADSLFTFADGQYVIHGAVGFPIFSRFEEITYTDSLIFIPQTPTLKPGEPNMFIKADDYILAVSYKNRQYPFFFDTGNDKTFLKRNFYLCDSASFNSLADITHTYGGVGGETTIRAKQAQSITLHYSGKEFKLDEPYIQTEDEVMDKNLYGSIGKDFMNLYKKRTMSFKEARMEFE